MQTINLIEANSYGTRRDILSPKKRLNVTI